MMIIRDGEDTERVKESEAGLRDVTAVKTRK